MSELTPENLEALLRFLNPDRELAGAQYEAIRRRLIRLFEWRGFTNAEDLTDETINRVARRIKEGTEVRSADPYSFFYGVANLLMKEAMRRSGRERDALVRDEWQATSGADEEDEEDGRLACLRDCLEQLPHDQRQLVLRYHQEDDHIRSRQMLSQELGIPMNALRIRVHRIRRKLEECVGDCLRAGSRRDRR